MRDWENKENSRRDKSGDEKTDTIGEGKRGSA